MLISVGIITQLV